MKTTGDKTMTKFQVNIIEVFAALTRVLCVIAFGSLVVVVVGFMSDDSFEKLVEKNLLTIFIASFVYYIIPLFYIFMKCLETEYRVAAVLKTEKPENPAQQNTSAKNKEKGN